MNPADPSRFYKLMPLADLVEFTLKSSGCVNDREFRGWRPGSITLSFSSRPDRSGKQIVRFDPIPMKEKLPIFSPGKAAGGIAQFDVRERADFSALDRFDDWPGDSPRLPFSGRKLSQLSRAGS